MNNFKFQIPNSRFFTLKGLNLNNHRWNRWARIVNESTTLKGLNIKSFRSSTLSGLLLLIGSFRGFHPRLFKLSPFRTFFGIILFLLLAGTLNAQDSLSVYLELAGKNNPGLQVKYLEYSAALEKVPQAEALPDPQATFGIFIQPMQLLGGNQIGSIGLMQMFPWFGTLKAAKDEASMMAKAKFESFNATKADLFYQVKTSWFQLMKYDHEITWMNKNIELLESLEKLALVKFQSPVTATSAPAMNETSSKSTTSGTMATMNSQPNGQNPKSSASSGSSAMSNTMSNTPTGLQNVLRVKMEILEQKNRLALLQDQRKTEEVRFNSLLNRDINTPVQLPDSLMKQSLPLEKLAIVDSIMHHNPMLAMLENETNSYASMEQKTKKMGLPMIGVGLNYMLIQERTGNTSMMNGKDMVMPMLSVSLPIYRKKYNAMQNEARLMQESGNQQITNLQNELLVQYQQMIQNLDDAERRIGLYQEQQELAQKTADLLITGFSTTGTDYEEVLRMELKVLDYGFKHIEAMVDYNTSVAGIEQLMNSVNN